MAVVAVAADSARYDAMDATTNISSIGGGPGAGVEPDFFYQGTGAISRKVTGAGFYSSTGANRNMTTTGRRTWLVKLWLTNYQSLTTGANKVAVRVGSGTGAFHEYILGSASVPYGALGGFVIAAIDPNIASHRSSTTGSPTLTACNYFAAYSDCSTSKSENLALDAIDVGHGLYLTGGDGVSADGNFADFVADDEGDGTNGRFGYVTSRGGVVYSLGKLVIGATSASGVYTTVATGFTASNRTVIFPDNLAQAGFSGLYFAVGNVGTTITLNGCVFSSSGTAAGEDTRAVADITGGGGSMTINGGSFTNFAEVNVSSADCDVIGTAFIQLDGMFLAGTLTDCVFTDGAQASAGIANIATANPALITGCSFTMGAPGHAIEFTNTGTYTFDGNTFSGYGADGSTTAAIYNTSGGLITLNIGAGGSTPTVRNFGASTTVLVVAPVTYEVTVIDNEDNSPIESARVLVWCSGAGNFPANDAISITRSGSTATVTHTAHGLATNDQVRIAGAGEYQYNINATITVTGVNTYTYQLQGTPATPATGSPVASLILIDGLTNASGVISDTRSYTANQGITGRVVKGTSSPVYIGANVSGTVSQAAGLSQTVPLVRDGA